MPVITGSFSGAGSLAATFTITGKDFAGNDVRVEQEFTGDKFAEFSYTPEDSLPHSGDNAYTVSVIVTDGNKRTAETISYFRS